MRRVLVRSHRRAMQSNQDFWKLLLQEEIQFEALQAAFNRIEASHRHAQQQYREVSQQWWQCREKAGWQWWRRAVLGGGW